MICYQNQCFQFYKVLHNIQLVSMSQNQKDPKKPLWKTIKAEKNNRNHTEENPVPDNSDQNLRYRTEESNHNNNDAYPQQEPKLQNLIQQFKGNNPSKQINYIDDQPFLNQELGIDLAIRQQGKTMPTKQTPITNDIKIQQNGKLLQCMNGQTQNVNQKKQDGVNGEPVNFQEAEFDIDQQKHKEVEGSEKVVNKSGSRHQQKLQRMKDEIKALANHNKNLLETLKINQEQLKIWAESTLINNILQYVNKVPNKTNGSQQHYIQHLQKQIEQVKKQKNEMRVLFESQIEQMKYEILTVQAKLQEAKGSNNQLEKQLITSKQENTTLYEQNFDLEQRVAQIDLEMNEKLKDLVIREQEGSRDAQNNAQFPDKEVYLYQINDLEEKIRILEDQCLSKSESELQLNHYKNIEGQLNERQSNLRTQEFELENGFKQLDFRKKQLDEFYRQLKLKEQYLRQQDKKLLAKFSELEEKEANLYRVMAEEPQNQYQRNHHKEHSYHPHIPQKHQSKHTRNYYEPIQNKYERPHRNLQSSQNRQGQYDILSHKGYNNRDIKSSRASNPKNLMQSSASKNRLGHSMAGNKRSSRTNSNTSHQSNDRLHQLGSKLERLRQQIRKQIHQAR